MAERAGKTREDYKRSNRGSVIQLIATGQCHTRSDLVRSMGLSKMAITNIVSELLQQKLLIETEFVQKDEAGRKPLGLAISPEAPKVAGVLITRDCCEAVVAGLDLEIIQREKITMEADMDTEKLIHILYQLLDTVLFERSNVLAIGVASIGPISVQAGMILQPYYFYDIKNVEVVKLIEDRYHLPVFFEHDNQSAVLAEHLFGNGRGYKDILFIGIGGGVGCGILNDGQRYSTRQGLPPEFGHVSIDVNGKNCVCGNRGCIETYIRTPELIKRFRYHSKKYYSYETFCKIHDNGQVKSILEDAISKLAAALVSTINILNSELILLGNDAVYWEPEYVTMLEELVNQTRYVKWDQQIIVKQAYFQKDASLMGAVCNAITEISKGNLLFCE